MNSTNNFTTNSTTEFKADNCFHIFIIKTTVIIFRKFDFSAMMQSFIYFSSNRENNLLSHFSFCVMALFTLVSFSTVVEKLLFHLDESWDSA